jgi:hypothetical protein
MFINVSHLKTKLGTPNEYSYLITDTNFSCIIVNNGLWMDAIIQCYEEKNLPVAPNLMRLIQSIWGDNIPTFNSWDNNYYSFKISKYKEDLLKYYILL